MAFTGSVALVCSLLVFFLWYPFPYRELSGGQALFGLIVAVDVVLGPILTWVVFDKRKPRPELIRDLCVIVMMQVLALGYGIWSVYQARPVYLVHAVDRFVVVSAADVDPADLPLAESGYRNLPFSGVALVGLRPSRDGSERMKSFELALAGKDLPVRPEYWQPLNSDNQEIIRQRAQPIRILMGRTPENRALLERWLEKNKVSEDQVLTLPVESRSIFWTALLDANTLDIIGYVPLDPL